MGVTKPSRVSAFSPLSCFWFRTLQTNQKGETPYPKAHLFFPCPACPQRLGPGLAAPGAAEDKAGNVQRGASSGMSFPLPFAPSPQPIAKDSDSGCNWPAHAGVELCGKVWGCFVLFISETKVSLSRPREWLSPVILGVHPFNMQQPPPIFFLLTSLHCWSIGSSGD